MKGWVGGWVGEGVGGWVGEGGREGGREGSSQLACVKQEHSQLWNLNTRRRSKPVSSGPC